MALHELSPTTQLESPWDVSSTGSSGRLDNFNARSFFFLSAPTLVISRLVKITHTRLRRSPDISSLAVRRASHAHLCSRDVWQSVVVSRPLCKSQSHCTHTTLDQPSPILSLLSRLAAESLLSPPRSKLGHCRRPSSKLSASINHYQYSSYHRMYQKGFTCILSSYLGSVSLSV